MIDKATGTFRAVQAKDFAILYRNSTHASLFQSELQALGIESKREESKGFFTVKKFEIFWSLLRFLNRPTDVLQFMGFFGHRSALSQTRIFFLTFSKGLGMHLLSY